MPDFFADPILNSPYDAPTRHWELDDAGRPTGRIVASRRCAEFVAAVPGQAAEGQPDLLDLSELTDAAALQTAIAEVRAEVDRWRARPNPLN
jgi:type III restriction enzyme